jgi:hypothetical protein
MSSNQIEDWLYDYVTQYIKSPAFRTPIKDFVDSHCQTFHENVEENTFQQGSLHKQFVQLIEDLLEKMLSEIGATGEQFYLAAKRGLNDNNSKKYYDQLISCNNYLYFKAMMIKRNLQLEKMAMKLLKGQAGINYDENNDLFLSKQEFESIENIRHNNETNLAIEMSLAIDLERQKILDLEDDELRVI